MTTNNSILCDTADKLRVSGINTIQIHPTLRCNLKCRHCYSFSSPMSKDSLTLENLKPFLKYAFQEGFTNLSFSGGEPMLFAELEETLQFSKSIGFRNAMVTNGMLFGSEKAKKIVKIFDLIAISIDGKPELHDYIRGQKGAFQKMIEGIKILKDSQIDFGFIHTISNQSWEDLIWLGDFAYQNGAKLLQLHPLENAGRTNIEFSEGFLNDITLHKIFIITNYLKEKFNGIMEIQLDLSHHEFLKSFPESFGIFRSPFSQNTHFSKMVNNIVINENGSILPITYGISETFSLGNIKTFNPAKNLFDSYTKEKYNTFFQLYNNTYEKILKNKNKNLVNWGELIITESHKFSPVI